MQINSYSIEESTDRMYCPSTGEVIFAPGYEAINQDAEAFIAYWHGDVLEEPFIKNADLKEAWDAFYSNWDRKNPDLDLWEALEKFFHEYPNDDWIVIECIYEGIACGPVATNVYNVVLKDTVIEIDPDYNEDEENEDE